MFRNLTSTRVTARVVAGALALSLVALPAAARRDEHAMERLTAMAAYVASLTSAQITFDSSVEVITTDLENIQFNSSGEMKLQRPDHLYVRRTGGFSDAEIFFDGKTVTISDATDHRYARLDIPGSVENLREKLRALPGIALPAAEILGEGAVAEMSADLTEAKTIGPAMISGELCEHLAFRTAEVDFQIWIHMGDKPRPCKLVINSKAVLGAPQYTLHVTSFKADEAFAEGTFDFKPAEGAKEVKLSEIGDLDEIPQAAAQ